MDKEYFLTELGFANKKQLLPDELTALGVDNAHYSGDFPAVFFKGVPKFGATELQEIAKIQRNIWNYRKVLFLYVVSPTEIRFYNCSQEPFNFKADNVNIEQELEKYELERCEREDKKKIREISEIFSAIAIDNGSIWLHEKKKYRDKINFQKRVDRKLVEAMLKTAAILKREGIEPKVVHAVLVRSLFIMYLEDRRATPHEFYIKGNSYLELLDDLDATYKFYDLIERYFNGNVFPVTPLEKKQIALSHLKRIKYCLYDGEPEDTQPKLFEWRLFDFSIIPVELLSEIYEHFLNEFDSEGKKKSGAFYTPPSLVELILNQVLPISSQDQIYQLKILDPACGSGIFLVEAYKRLVKRWENANPGRKISFKELSTILEQSIFGIELEPSAIKVSAFSLYLSMLDFLDPKDLWLRDGETFPFLIKDAESFDERDKKGKNLFRTNTLEDNGEFETQQYDLIIGNPPFSRKSIPAYAKKYIKKYNFASELVIPFIHKSALLAEKGKVALVFNSKILTNTSKTYQNFRAWLFQTCYVEKVYNLSIFRKAPKTFGGQLFSSAVGPTSIVFFSPQWPEKIEPSLEYWAPKTFIRNDVVEGVITDSSDFKYLPREICQQPDSRIWKIAQWGTMADYFLIERIKKLKKIGSLLNDKNSGVGHQILDNSTKKPIIDNEISNLRFVLPEKIQRYATGLNSLVSINSAIKTLKSQKIYLTYYNKKNTSEIPPIDAFRRLGKSKSAYYKPHLLIKEGLKGKQVCASFLNEDCSFNSKVYGIHHSSQELLKTLTCYFNSNFTTYFLFLTSASWGVEREEIKPNELKALPLLDEQYYEQIAGIYDKIAEIQKGFFNHQDAKIYIQEAETIIRQSLNLLPKEEILISDTVKYTISLFFDGQKSIALRPISQEVPETESYSKILCDEINNFLVAGDIKVIARYYQVSSYTPLCMIVIYFVDSSKVAPPERCNSDEEFHQYLKIINNFTIKEYSRNIYVHKQIRFYDNDRIFIIKPNQKRFWTRSQGIDDAHSIITEIAMQEE